MLSILIPIYNFDVRKLVSQLYEQAKKENIEFEIILADDASENKFQKINSETDKLEKVRHIRLKKNIGRSKIRNFLAEKAKYRYLLFIDCDMISDNHDFIKNYIKNINSNPVICGGIKYQKTPPENENFYLRWYYGTKRENISAPKRNKNPYMSFMTGNFIISKKIFRKIKFNEKITTYGHEDTLFGIELQRKKIKIRHIDNPLVHTGLEDNLSFIKKTETGIENLIYISKNYDYSELAENIKLLKTARKLLFLKPLILIFFKIFKKIIVKKLKGKNPKLFLFDFYKLAIFYKKTS